MFDITGPNFERLINRFIDTIYDLLYEIFVKNWGEEITTLKHVSLREAFLYFTISRYATDVTYQLSYIPLERVQEVSLYYSG